MEEGLHCARLAAVVGELDALERGPGRRLQLAAEASGVTAFALRRGLRPARPAQAAASAAVTRWRVEAESFAERPRWRVELLRCRGAAPGQWYLEWNDATGGFAMAAALRDRPPAFGAGRPGAGVDQPRLAV
jgi:protein ImuA